MDQNKVKNEVEKVTGYTALVVGSGIALLAGAGYLIWRNRSKIKQIVQETDLDQVMSQAGKTAQDAAQKAKKVLHYADANDTTGARTTDLN